MAASPLRIEISDNPELLRLVERAEEAGQPVVLERDGRRVAEVWPVAVRLMTPDEARRWRPTPGQIARARLAAGGWSDIDTDAMLEAVYAAREAGSRPPEAS